MSHREPNDEQLFATVDELHVIHNMPLFVIADLAGYSQPVLASARTKGRLSAKFRKNLASALLRIQAVLAEKPHFDTRNADLFRQEFAKQKGGRLEVIPQTHGSHYIHEFAASIELGAEGPARFVAGAQMSPHVIHAPIVSPDGQQWIAMWAEAMQAVLEHRGFPEFVTRNGGDERKALTILANLSLAKILEDVGREKVLLLMAALLRSGELKAASQGAGSKN